MSTVRSLLALARAGFVLAREGVVSALPSDGLPPAAAMGQKLAGLVEQTFIRARSQYGGGAWSSQVVKLLEDALGTDLRAPGFPAELQ